MTPCPRCGRPRVSDPLIGTIHARPDDWSGTLAELAQCPPADPEGTAS